MDATKCSQREHVQLNSQDLDQEQNVHMDPVQTNSQNVHIVISKDNYCSVITGNVYIEKNRNVVKDVAILLFFGYECNTPVYKTKSDMNGNFKIEDLPPGFYTIAASYYDYPIKKAFIKLLPGQTVHQTIIFW